MKTKFDVGDTLHLAVTVDEIKITSDNRQLYKINVPGCGTAYWFSVGDFLEGQEDEQQT